MYLNLSAYIFCKLFIQHVGQIGITLNLVYTLHFKFRKKSTIRTKLPKKQKSNSALKQIVFEI